MDKKYFTFEQALDQYVESAKDPEAGIGTGYSLDKTCGLMSTGELALLWARSGAGKSTLMLNIIANTPEVPTVFFNMEMRARTMAEWLATIQFNLPVSYRELPDVLLNGDQHPLYEDVMAALEKGMANKQPMVWLSEQQSPLVDDLARTVDDITVETGVRPQRVFVDHLSLMYGARDYEGLLTVAHDLHQWAQKDELLVVCAQQTGRSGGGSGERNDGHMPVTLSSGVFGGEHDADWILGAWRPGRDPKFRKAREDFKKPEDFFAMEAERDRVKHLTHLAVVKNRPFGELMENGCSLFWNTQSRRLEEY